MPTKGKKKKATAANSRGFATTSIPTKAKEVVVEPEPAVEEEDVPVSWEEAAATEDVAEREKATSAAEEAARQAKQAEEDADTEELTRIVENGTRAFSKLYSEIEVERRSRKACISIKLPDDMVDKILDLEATTALPTSARQQQTGADATTDIFKHEMLLRKLGVDATAADSLLKHAPDVSVSDDLLTYMALRTDENMRFDVALRAEVAAEPEEAVTPPPSPKITKRPSRMTELLSDEEDQDLIMAHPNRYFIRNHLELMVLRVRAKKDRTLGPLIARKEKRSKVIEQTLTFDKQASMREVKRQVQGGYLERAAARYREDVANGTLKPAPEMPKSTAAKSTAQTPKSSATSDIDEDGWLAIQRSLADLSEANEEADRRQSDQIASAADDILAEAADLSFADAEDEDDEDLIPSLFEMVEAPSPAKVEHAEAQVDVSGKKPFPVQLPKSSSNISPVKLLQTYLKRVDKAAKEEFDPTGPTVVLRFASAKLTRRKVTLRSDLYHFPDDETARNFLSMKAIFTVPELMGDKAGTRFSGPFRQAWQILQDEAKELHRQTMAGKVANAKRILEHRQASKRETRGNEVLDPSQILDSSRRQGKTFNREASDDLVYEMWQHLQESIAYDRMWEYRASLPIAHYRHALLDSVENNQITILCGETGCGKSTQLPTFILENELSQGRSCRIYVTEPRRISAISLANRVSAELGESRKAIQSGESLLGFSIRLDSQVSDTSRLIYATTGIVLRMLEDSPDLGGLTHLVIDEVHERSIESDFLLIVVRRLLQHRRDLKVVLMSATLQAEKFNDYFGGHCCIFEIPGRTFPVEQRFLEDVLELTDYACEEGSHYAKSGAASNVDTSWEVPEEDDEVSDVSYSEKTKRSLRLLDPYKINFDLIIRLLDVITDDHNDMTKAILVFLPGLAEIRRLLDTLLAHRVYSDNRRWYVYALHSSVSSEKQQAAFDVPPRGIRKIVLATNIAETGITIPDITCVIDAGKHKESRFDARRQLSRLIETFIAKANAKQRMGRAGRVQPGVCYHLFSRARFEKMAEHQLPEFQRLNLDELALRVKTVGLGRIDEVLSEALDPPTPENIRRSVNNLVEVGALDEKQNLTLLGKYLAKLPVDAILGKLIVYGLWYGCLDPCVVIAASISAKSPFETPIDREREANVARALFERGQSDFLTIWTAYAKWRAVCEENPRNEAKFCRDNYVSAKNLAAIEELRLQYLKILVDTGLMPAGPSERTRIERARFASARDGFIKLPHFADCNTATPTFIELSLCAAFYPNLVSVEDGFKTVNKNQPVAVHPSSCNFKRDGYLKRWLYFYALLKTKQATHAHETGLADDYIVALVCGQPQAKPLSGLFVLDHNRVRFATPDLRTLTALATLRKHLDEGFANFLTGDRPTENPWMDVLRELVGIYEELARQVNKN